MFPTKSLEWPLTVNKYNRYRQQLSIIRLSLRRLILVILFLFFKQRNSCYQLWYVEGDDRLRGTSEIQPRK